MITTDQTLLALGGNQTGPWGNPAATLRRAIDTLQPLGVEVIMVSPFGKTRPVGGPVGAAHSYVNAVISVRCTLSPAALLRLLKTVERSAGRRTRGKWTARPLDLDIISFKGVRTFWPRRRPGTLTLPHPEAHWRGFVLAPLLMIEPHWFHNGLGVSGKRLLARLPHGEQRAFALLAEAKVAQT